MLYMIGRLNVCKLPYIKKSPYSHYFCRGPQQIFLHEGRTYRRHDIWRHFYREELHEERGLATRGIPLCLAIWNNVLWKLSLSR